MASPAPIAVSLLKEELRRLTADHFADGRASACSQCRRAARVRREIIALGGKA